MTHSFLVEAGRWTIEGKWWERHKLPVAVKGGTIVVWSQDCWFTMATKLFFPDGERQEVSLKYRGRLNTQEYQYTYMLEHSWLGQAEGEGWIAAESISQHYWLLGDPQRHTVFETYYRLDGTTYYLSSAILGGHYLTNMIEATLIRQL